MAADTQRVCVVVIVEGIIVLFFPIALLFLDPTMLDIYKKGFDFCIISHGFANRGLRARLDHMDKVPLRTQANTPI